MKRQQRQLQAQLTGKKVLSTQAFPGIGQQRVLDQLGIGLADVDGGDERFQVGGCQPRRRGLAILVLHGSVAKRQARQVLQGKFDERDFQGL
ncbi:hypothetical protein D3C79_967020 [compost metagenome]